ncbi:MAG: formylglycine-generating enzyme family protein [Planctomycetes bacterium]|nr:formylglycine-generating enzyme family protein [Planctomycetota bacterium]
MGDYVISWAMIVPIVAIGPNLVPEQSAKGMENGGCEGIKEPERTDQERPTVRSGQPTAKQSPAGVAQAGNAHKRLQIELAAGVRMELVLIPAGQFTMGDDEGADWAKPLHRVAITKPFYLGKHEVTQEQWEAVMGGNPSHFKGPKHPVDSVSWDDCKVFVTKLNSKFPVGGVTFILPTEAQWEYACRAGAATAFSFGDDADKLEEYAWWDTPMITTHPVGQKKPNAWGLYDMHGNVAEWCSDWWARDYYRKSPAEDPKGPATGQLRVLRGAAWDFEDSAIFRCGCRRNDPPGRRFEFIGFRVAGEGQFKIP